MRDAPVMGGEGGRKEIYVYPTESPNTIAHMLDFCARRGIEPVVEMSPCHRPTRHWTDCVRARFANARY